MWTFYWTVFPYSSKYSFKFVFPSLALICLSQNQTRYFSNCGMNSSVPPTPSHSGSRIRSSTSRRNPRTPNYPGSTFFAHRPHVAVFLHPVRPGRYAVMEAPSYSSPTAFRGCQRQSRNGSRNLRGSSASSTSKGTYPKRRG